MVMIQANVSHLSATFDDTTAQTGDILDGNNDIALVYGDCRCSAAAKADSALAEMVSNGNELSKSLSF